MALQYDGTMPVFNRPETIKSISTATALRRTLGEHDLIPEQTIKGPHWHKKKGWGGDGKIFHENILGECAAISGDSQRHITGQEYRVISVGNKVIQAFRKDEIDGADIGIHEWIWQWVGVSGINNNGIIPLVKRAVDHIPEGNHSVFGWDIIVGDERPYIIECNTSPGVNDATAERIYNAIKKEVEENDG